MIKSSSRRYGVEVGSVKLTTAELDLIRDNARTYLLDDHGFDTSAAWVKATLAHLVKTGVLKVDKVPNPLELEAVSEVHNIDSRPKRY